MLRVTLSYVEKSGRDRWSLPPVSGVAGPV